MEQYAGRPIARLDGPDKATGKAKYAGDYYMEEMLELAVVRSERAHAELLFVDASLVPPDIRVFTASDLAENVIEGIIEDQPVLAFDKVRYFGEPIAIVAAKSRNAALKAARLVNVGYRELPVVETPRQAYGKDSATVHEKGNLLCDFYNHKGDVDRTFSKCDLVLEEDFSVPVQDHGYMEPEAGFAYVRDGVLYMIASSQNVFHDKQMIMRALGLSENRVQVKAAAVGGGFGGKDGHLVQIFVALAAWLTKCPARLVSDRRESLIASYKRHAADMHVKIGFTKEGKILAFDGESYLDTGAYAGLGPAVLGLFSEHMAGPYKIPNVRIHTHLMYTNKAPAHAMRGFGAPQGAWATETIMDRAAVALKIDPIRLRYDNALEEGAVGALGQTMEHCVGLKEALKLVENSPLWQERRLNTDPAIGYGVAVGHLSCGLGKGIPDSAKVEISSRADGAVEVKVGLVDIGQGSMTAIAAIAADALSLPIEKVYVVMADTTQTYDCGSTAGSRSVYIAGNAVINAAAEYKRRQESGEKNISAIGEAKFAESKMSFQTPGFPHAMYTFIAQAVKLKIDFTVGRIHLLDIVAATEAGRILNPLSLDGQIQGGVAMSIGYALGEDFPYRNGIPQFCNFSTYLLPTALDVPHIQSVLVESYEKSGPLGVKGAAEVSTVAIAPAIGAAVYASTGVRCTRLPIDISQFLISSGDYVKAQEPKNINYMEE